MAILADGARKVLWNFGVMDVYRGNEAIYRGNLGLCMFSSMFMVHWL